MEKLIQTKVLYPELSYKICGLCFETHNELGRFMSEKSYGDFIEKLLKINGIKYQREFPMPTSFDGEANRRNIADFIIEDSVILELKTKAVLGRDDFYQVKRYLTASNKRLAILVNFQQKRLMPKRILN